MADPRHRGDVTEDAACLRASPRLEDELDVLIESLVDLDVDRLRLQWRNHLGGTAPAHSPRWLLRRLLVFRLQAAAFGDLDKSTLRLLRHPKDAGAESSVGRPFERRSPTTRDGARLKSGALLVREWNGRLERVMVLENGFAWNGKIYRSLSQIAKAMTGTSWNGHRFFGLRPAKLPRSQTMRRDPSKAEKRRRAFVDRASHPEAECVDGGVRRLSGRACDGERDRAETSGAEVQETLEPESIEDRARRHGAVAVAAS